MPVFEPHAMAKQCDTSCTKYSPYTVVRPNAPLVPRLLPCSQRALQALPTRPVPWQNETIWKQCPLLQGQDPALVVAQHPVQMALFRRYGKGRPSKAVDEGIEND